VTCHRRILGGRRDLLAPAAAFPQRYPCLLESVVHGTAQSRYDILFAFPRERLTLHADGRLRDDAGVVREGRFLDALDAAWQAARLPPESDGLPFHGGWVLLLAYDWPAKSSQR
jgi:anthranilate synthase component 1